MVPHINCQTVLVPASGTGAIEQGLLIFADDALMVVVMRLQNAIDENLEDLRCC